MNTTTRVEQFRNLVRAQKYDDILALAKRLVNEGSHMLDLCCAIVGEDEKGYVSAILEKVATRVPAPILIDSTEADVVEEALKRIPGKPIINSINLEDGEKRTSKGLDMAIVNYLKIYPLYKIPEAEIELARKLIFRDESNGEPLSNYMAHFSQRTGTKEEATVTEVETLSTDDKLKYAIIQGEKSIGNGASRRTLEQLLDDALQQYTPLDLINNVLLDGMRTVGELFGARKMQLPSVLDSASVMKQAVAYLEPKMEKIEGMQKGTIVLATVKGDVHDIGKNLVDIILSNNGYRVVNLGIKQRADN